MKKQKGITLIALIITIIVMLILVGVTINIALNGGLFTTTRKAASDTQKETEKETLLSAIAGAYDIVAGKVDSIKLKTNLPGWIVDEEGPFICTSPKQNVFVVHLNGKIEEKKGPFTWKDVGLDVETNIEYKADFFNGIITFSEDGKIEIFDNVYYKKIGEIDATIEDNINSEERVVDCSLTINGDTQNLKLTMNEADETDKKVYVEIEGKGIFTLTKAEYDNVNVYSNEEVLKRLGIAEYTGTYKGTWTVIGTENGKTKLVSTRNVTSYQLGYKELRAINANPAVDENVPTTAEKLKRAIWSYRNVEDTLNQVIQEKTKEIVGARSIKLGDIEELVAIEKGEEYGKEVTYDYDNHQNQIFIDKNDEEIIIDSAEKKAVVETTYYSATLTEEEIGTLAKGEYLLASPAKHCFNDSADFFVFCINEGKFNYKTLFDSYGLAGWRRKRFGTEFVQ